MFLIMPIQHYFRPIFKSKNFPLSDLNEDRVKKTKFLGIVSLFLFVIDIVILAVFLPKIKG